jgi:hypothetical protein
MHTPDDLESIDLSTDPPRSPELRASLWRYDAALLPTGKSLDAVHERLAGAIAAALRERDASAGALSAQPGVASYELPASELPLGLALVQAARRALPFTAVAAAAALILVLSDKPGDVRATTAMAYVSGAPGAALSLNAVLGISSSPASLLGAGTAR